MDILYCNNNTRAENDLKNIIGDIVSSISLAELRHVLCVKRFADPKETIPGTSFMYDVSEPSIYCNIQKKKKHVNHDWR